MRDLNRFNKKLLEAFSAGQKYLRINGHPIPLMLDSIGDESVINNLDQRKYYVQLYTIKMLGYLLDEDEFKVTPAISRGILFFETEEDSNYAGYQIVAEKDTNIITLNIHFKPGINSFKLPVKQVVTYSEIINYNISTFTVKKNGIGVIVSAPFTVKDNDVVEITITKVDVTENAYMTLKGVSGSI
jgi:hypothetical protein